MDLGENKNWAEQTALSFDAVEKALWGILPGTADFEASGRLRDRACRGKRGREDDAYEAGAGDGYSGQRNRIVLGILIGQRRKTGEEGCGSCLWRTSDSRKFYGSDGRKISGRGFMRTSTGITLRGFQERFAIPGNKPIRRFSAGMKAKLALAGVSIPSSPAFDSGRTVKQSGSSGEGGSDGDVKRALAGRRFRF